MSRSVYMASSLGTGICKTPYLSFISVDVHKYWLTASIIPYLCTAPCPVFRTNPQAERESHIGTPADGLPSPIQLSRTCHDSQAFRLNFPYRCLSVLASCREKVAIVPRLYTCMHTVYCVTSQGGEGEGGVQRGGAPWYQ